MEGRVTIASCGVGREKEVCVGKRYIEDWALLVKKDSKVKGFLCFIVALAKNGRMFQKKETKCANSIP